MKKLFILAVILGYTALAPVCFLSAETISSPHSMNTNDTMIMSEQNSANDCSSGIHCVDHSDSTGGISHHMGMYSTFSGFTQTQNFLSFTSIVDALIPTLFFFILYTLLFSRLSTRFLLYIKKGKEISSIFRSNFLKWLSLSTNSPAYFLVM